MFEHERLRVEKEVLNASRWRPPLLRTLATPARVEPSDAQNVDVGLHQLSLLNFGSVERATQPLGPFNRGWYDKNKRTGFVEYAVESLPDQPASKKRRVEEQ